MKKKKLFVIRLISAAAAAAMLFCAAGCSKEKSDNTPSAEKTNKNPDGTYFDSGETFCRGVWAVDDGESRVGYYIFFDDENGKFCDAQLGMEVSFTVQINDSSVDFCLGASDFSDPTTVEKLGGGKRTLTWTNENRTENLTLLGEQEPDTFSYFTTNELSEMAMDYYKQKKGKRPETAEVTVSVDGMATIQLRNRVGKKGKVIAEYQVDSITGKGTADGKGEEIVFEKNDSED